MGRKKNYDRKTLIEKAMELFRDNGYAGTSTQMLVKELGVNRFSLYSEFGSKLKLFEAALELYQGTVIEQSYGPLETPEAGVEEIRGLFDFYARAGRKKSYGRGCLLCNSAVEFGPTDPSGSSFVKGYFDRLSGAFRNALNNAREKGQLRNTVEIKKEADLFTAAALGLFVMIRAQAPASVIENAAKSSIGHLEALCK